MQTAYSGRCTDACTDTCGTVDTRVLHNLCITQVTQGTSADMAESTNLVIIMIRFKWRMHIQCAEFDLLI